MAKKKAETIQDLQKQVGELLNKIADHDDPKKLEIIQEIYDHRVFELLQDEGEDEEDDLGSDEDDEEEYIDEDDDFDDSDDDDLSSDDDDE